VRGAPNVLELFSMTQWPALLAPDGMESAKIPLI
jgi:hypothetical protein